LEENAVSPSTQECGLELCALSPQLEFGKSLVKRKQITAIESLLEELQPMQRCFADVIKLLRAALTIPVTSATAECSSSALKRINSYLRAMMTQGRLDALAVLSIEKELTIGLDLDRVIDKFYEKGPTRIQLK
jgi:hypothetical protein